MTKRSIALATPAMGDEEWIAIREPIRSGWVAQGPKVAEFERAFAAYHKATYAIAVNNCTAGLHLALQALGIGPGDEVIVPAFTWVSTANAPLYCGAKPVFVDIDATYNIDPDKIAGVITARTKAVIPVHLFGRCADIEAVRAALTSQVAIVEDAACAAGAQYRGQFAGTLGRVAAFSFHPRKSITTGEGGMITTGDGEIADRLKVLRNHGMSPFIGEGSPSAMADIEVIGYNYRLTDIQAAIGLVQLSKLQAFISERSRWAAFYRSKLGGINWLKLPDEPADGVHAWQSYVIKLDAKSAPLSRDEFIARLLEAGISCRPGTYAVHTLSYYRRELGVKPEDCPIAVDAAANTVCIPLHNRMHPEDYAYVADTILRICD